MGRRRRGLVGRDRLFRGSLPLHVDEMVGPGGELGFQRTCSLFLCTLRRLLQGLEVVPNPACRTNGQKR